MSRPPGPRKPVRNFETEQQYAGSGITPAQAKAINSLRNALNYYKGLNDDDSFNTATKALVDDDALHWPPK